MSQRIVPEQSSQDQEKFNFVISGAEAKGKSQEFKGIKLMMCFIYSSLLIQSHKPGHIKSIYSLLDKFMWGLSLG